MGASKVREVLVLFPMYAIYFISKKKEKRQKRGRGGEQKKGEEWRKSRRILYEEQVIVHQRCPPRPTTTLHPSVWETLVREMLLWGSPVRYFVNKF